MARPPPIFLIPPMVTRLATHTIRVGLRRLPVMRRQNSVVTEGLQSMTALYIIGAFVLAFAILNFIDLGRID